MFAPNGTLLLEVNPGTAKTVATCNWDPKNKRRRRIPPNKTYVPARNRLTRLPPKADLDWVFRGGCFSQMSLAILWIPNPENQTTEQINSARPKLDSHQIASYWSPEQFENTLWASRQAVLAAVITHENSRTHCEKIRIPRENHLDIQLKYSWGGGIVGGPVPRLYLGTVVPHGSRNVTLMMYRAAGTNLEFCLQ